MKKSTKKKASKKKSAPSKKTPRAKKAAKPATQTAAPASASKGAVAGGLVTKQPQVKQQAAVANAMFLHTNDAWSQQYFDPNDLHSKEREVFG
jgi:hypothetical protein